MWHVYATSLSNVPVRENMGELEYVRILEILEVVLFVSNGHT